MTRLFLPLLSLGFVLFNRRAGKESTGTGFDGDG
jgi:hypothetical protein